MTYGELSELTRREIADDVGSVPDDFRITPAQMLTYANEAADEIRIRSRLVDSTTNAVCAVATEANRAIYDLDPRVVLVLRAKMTGAKTPLKRISHTILDEQREGWEDESGVVEAVVTGLHTGKIHLFRQPASIGIINLTVVRRQLQPMAADKDNPDLPSHLHPLMIYWMKHRIYSNQDSEIFDRSRSDINLALFEQQFGKRPDLSNVFGEMQLLRDTAGDSYADYGEYV